MKCPSGEDQAENDGYGEQGRNKGHKARYFDRSRFRRSDRTAAPGSMLWNDGR
jgi:hypothetical protein